MDLLDYAQKFEVRLTVKSGGHAREDAPVAVDLDFSKALGQIGARGSLDVAAIRLVEIRDAQPVERVPVQFEPSQGFDSSANAVGKVSWILEGLTPASSERSYSLYFDVLESGQKGLPDYGTGVHLAGLTGNPRRDRVVEIEINGQVFTVYNFGAGHAHLYKPYFHPLFGPSGRSITQDKEHPGTLKGHYWHRGLFVGHQQVNGTSFWEEAEGCGRQLHQEFTQLVEGPVYASFTERNRWRKPDGTDVLEEHRQVTTYNLPADRRIMDFQLVLRPLRDPVLMEARAYNLLVCRFSAAMDVAPSSKGQAGGGMVVNSEGEANVGRDHETPGARAQWMDHSGPNGPQWEGLAVFDSPANPRYPTYWLNWHNLTMGPSFTFAEPYTIPVDQELSLRYRIYVHEGDFKTRRVVQKYNEYIHPVEVTVGIAKQAG